MTERRILWLVYALVVFAGALGAVAVIANLIPRDDTTSVVLGSLAVWLGCSAVFGGIVYIWSEAL